MSVTVPALPAVVAYAATEGVVRWAGYEVSDEDAFRVFLNGSVATRVQDVDLGEPFEDELQALATTGLGAGFLKQFLAAVPEEKGWEIGEALAETILGEDANRDIIWPWNERRDRRTPQASLPGADLVGFCRDAQGIALLFGEVKTSSDVRVPPQVMYGRSGMTWQLENNATHLGVQYSLLKWLRCRCLTADLVEAYREAVGRYLNSSGKDILLVGVLLRDTGSNESDVKGRARYLAGCLADPMRVEIMAWYFPVAISDWAAILGGVA